MKGRRKKTPRQKKLVVNEGPPSGKEDGEVRRKGEEAAGGSRGGWDPQNVCISKFGIKNRQDLKSRIFLVLCASRGTGCQCFLAGSSRTRALCSQMRI